MYYLSLIYFVRQPLHVSGVFIAHHQEQFTVYVQQLLRWFSLKSFLNYSLHSGPQDHSHLKSRSSSFCFPSQQEEGTTSEFVPPFDFQPNEVWKGLGRKRRTYIQVFWNVTLRTSNIVLRALRQYNALKKDFA
jgi:hypothetical protein